MTIAKDDYSMISMNAYVEVGKTKNLGEIEMKSLFPEDEPEESNMGLLIVASLSVIFVLGLIIVLVVVIRQRGREYPIFLEDEGWMRMYPHRK